MAEVSAEVEVEPGNNIPENPGVYVFKDNKKKVLYIGKAKNLKKRIKSYFLKNHIDLKTKILVEKISDVNWIITQNEVEALILENNLIKKYKPPFNIRLVDDKTYPYLKINMKEDFPRIEIVRKKDDKDSIYFGPYTSALTLKSTINFVQKNFKLRKCNDKKFKNRIRPCLNYQINLCYAPCCGKINKEEYKEIFSEVILFLKGKHQNLIKMLENKMYKLSEELKFEEAAKIRDIIKNINEFIKNQNQNVEINKQIDADVFYYKIFNDFHFFYVLRMSNGKILDSQFYKLEDFIYIDESPLEKFIPIYYEVKKNLPNYIIVNEKFNFNNLKEYFLKKFNKVVKFKYPKRGIFQELLKLSEKNLSLKIKFLEEKNNILNVIKNKLGLNNIPNRIDAFDISTFQGKQSVGGRVVFINGKKEKSLYRKYKIKTVEDNIVNDYAMMKEVLQRSIKEYIEDKNFPNLILIDGGKGQLNIAYKVLKDNFLHKDIDLIAIAKDKKIDKIYKANIKAPIDLEKNKDIALFFMNIRDEVHRFTVSYHRKKDEMEKFSSILTQIDGIGEIRAHKLLQYYKDLSKIKKASLEELQNLPFLNKKVAENIFNFFHSNSNSLFSISS